MTGESEFELVLKFLDTGLTLGLLLMAIFWFKKRDEEKDAQITSLNKEFRESIEENLNKTNDAIVNNTMALNAIREAFKNV